MNENIVVLGSGADWCGYITKDFEKNKNSKVINSEFPSSTNRIINFFIRMHFSPKINKLINLPLKRLWFKYFAKNMNIDKKKKIIIIIYDRNRLANNEQFLIYLKKYYSNCKLIYIFTNIVKISGACDNDFINKLNYYYDLVYAFDPSDSPKYNFKYNPLLYSKCSIKDIDYKKGQVFYVGRAKDRYDMLMKVYEKLEDYNINKKFYIVGVPEDKQKHKESIIYNKLIPYQECLKNILESDCLLDVIQGESEGFTIKVCEAIFYDKLLITTNKNIKKMPFYDERYIRVIESASDIDIDFFKNAGNVHYKKEGKEYFSVDKFLENLKQDLEEIE